MDKDERFVIAKGVLEGALQEFKECCEKSDEGEDFNEEVELMIVDLE